MRMMQRKVSREGYQTLIELLPQLNAYHDDVRLDVLSKIDRVLVIERLTWEDLAAMIPEPAWARGEVLAAVACIEQHGDHADVNAAQNFLNQLRQRAESHRDVYLTPRQAAWLSRLREKAQENEVAFVRERGCEPLPPPKKKGRKRKASANVSAGDNVVQLVVHAGVNQ